MEVWISQNAVLMNNAGTEFDLLFTMFQAHMLIKKNMFVNIIASIYASKVGSSSKVTTRGSFLC